MSINVTLPAQSLAEAMTVLCRFANPKAVLPVLSQVMVEATYGNKLILRTTNLESVMVMELSAQVDGTGITLVEAKTLLEAVKPYKRGNITLTEGINFRLLINAGEVVLLGLDPQEFPPTYLQSEFTDQYGFWSRDLAEAIMRTEAALSTDEARPALMGFCLEQYHEAYTITAADGFRIHHWGQGVPDGLVHRLIVPATPALILAKLLAKQTTQVSMAALRQELPATHWRKSGMYPYAIEFTWHYQTKALEAQARLVTQVDTDNFYADYQGVYPQPKDCMSIFTADRQALLDALNGTLPVAKRGNGIVYLAVRADEMGIKAQAEDAGEVVRYVPGEGTHTGEIYQCFNNWFLLDALEAVETTRVELHLNARHLDNGARWLPSPALVRAVPNDTFYALVMPYGMGDNFPREITRLLKPGHDVTKLPMPYLGEEKDEWD